MQNDTSVLISEDFWLEHSCLIKHVACLKRKTKQTKKIIKLKFKVSLFLELRPCSRWLSVS